ncbi:XRE family transcriptional regulator [Photorhabdus asymbiotica]|uniref:XRE family transcriptional regulator n=1 Tax=Photorhabdus asymbiotica TaxID=291112 RepID=UPI003DA76DC4
MVTKYQNITHEFLIETQAKLGSSDQEMADLLGIALKTWYNRKSDNSVKRKLLSKLEYEYLILLRGEHPSLKLE